MTHYEVVERFVGYALVRARPKTGRTHQIRLHLTHAGYPVLCDRLYGGPESEEDQRTGIDPARQTAAGYGVGATCRTSRCSNGRRCTRIDWRSIIRQAANDCNSKRRSPPTWSRHSDSARARWRKRVD